MAFNYLMSICCGERESAEALATAFDRTPVECEEKRIPFGISVSSFRDEGGEDWFVNLQPSQEGGGSRWPNNGPHGPEEKNEAIVWGREMFARLERAHAPFSFAVIGVECDEWRTSPQVAELVADGDIYDDLVICDALWTKAGSPSGWKEWGPGYRFHSLRFSSTIAITKFAGRHFSSSFNGTKVLGLTQAELVELANRAIGEGAMLVDGYAPFCKHLFLTNSTPTRAGVARITPENQHLLRSGYAARREEELPVLQRWFEGLEAPRAEFLDLILYSREQLEQEDDGKPETERDVPDAEWGIVAINAELQSAESPMPPITMMRNALGKDEGGSGVKLDRDSYAKSVEFWSSHAVIH